MVRGLRSRAAPASGSATRVERHIEEQQKEERAGERRQRAATVGTGNLHAEIAAAAEQPACRSRD